MRESGKVNGFDKMAICLFVIAVSTATGSEMSPGFGQFESRMEVRYSKEILILYANVLNLSGFTPFLIKLLIMKFKVYTLNLTEYLEPNERFFFQNSPNLSE